MSAFLHIGQIIELDATGFGAGALLRDGDRGTVLTGAIINGFGNWEHKILWHRTGKETTMVQERLRLFEDPMDRPGRDKDAFTTVQALSVVLKEEQPHALSEVLREMERARMTAEDWRGAMVSPYGNDSDTRDPHYRNLSWREFGQEKNEMCDHLCNVIDGAEDILSEGRRQIRMAWNDPRADSRAPLTAAYNAMCEAEETLRDNDSDSE